MRALPSAARFSGHTFENARRIHPLRRSRANRVALRKSVVLLARGSSFERSRKFTLSAEAASMRPMGCALPKAWFWHAPQTIHEKSFKLIKLFSVILRATPPFASLGGGFSLFAACFKGTPLINVANSPFSQKPCGKSGEKSKSAILDFSKIFDQKRGFGTRHK